MYTSDRGSRKPPSTPQQPHSHFIYQGGYKPSGSSSGNSGSGGVAGGSGVSSGSVSAPAAPSYDPYSDYIAAMERIQRAQMEQMERLRQEQQRARDAAYQTASEQQKKDYEYSQGQLNDTTGRALQEAYINKMLTLKNLPQQLTAQGLNGGASETTLGSMNNNYANARNSLENERQTQLAALLNTYQNNMAQLEAQRASGEAASISQFAPQLLGLTANNGVDLINLIQGTGLATATPNYSRRRLNEEEYY